MLYLVTPLNLNYFWNFGSLLIFFLCNQLLSGILLSFHYINFIDFSFWSIEHIMRDINFGWLFRYIHSNGASFFFIFIYLHIARNLFYSNYRNLFVWFSGICILFILMAISFLGYVLPFGQMSLWGATVITSLFSVIPFFGNFIVNLIWGSFSISSPTLSRFFSLHFILPFVLIALIFCHILFLHVKGSTNPLGFIDSYSKILFFIFYSIKDLLGIFVIGFIFCLFVFYFPNLFGDSDNYIEGNSLVTPLHIKPEWYFLFAYAILRAIPNKVFGVLGLVFSILFLIFLPFIDIFNSRSFSFIKLVKFSCFVICFILLSWLGSLPVNSLFSWLSLLIGGCYFLFLL